MIGFKIEQIAICPQAPKEARKLLEKMGAVEWVEDEVIADGKVGCSDAINKANLSFNYELISGKEFEILDYTAGANWMENSGRVNSVSHLGMHCSAEDLLCWRRFFQGEGIAVAQEVITKFHTNEAIKGKRNYNYVIFDTKHILGVDLKFIVRIDNEKV